MAYYFNLPTYDDLKKNPTQLRAVAEPGAVALTGGPGTGKSVVSIWRHLTNYKSDIRKSVLLTYTKSLRFFLAQSMKSEAEKENEEIIKDKIINAFNNVSSANSWIGNHYDEIIIDEAQDLPENKLVIISVQKKQHINGGTQFVYDDKRINQISNIDAKLGNGNITINEKEYNIEQWYYYNENLKRWKISVSNRGYLNYFKQKSEIISYGADNKQILYPKKSTTENKLIEIFPNNKHYKLFLNYRNTFEILNFVRHAVDYDINQSTLDRLEEGEYSRRGKKPVLKLIDNDILQNDSILDIVESFNDGTINIAILVPLVNQVNKITQYFIDKNYILNGNGEKSFTNYHNEIGEIIKIDNIHITTFKSSKGLEFDVVIIPYFGEMHNYIENLNVVEDKDYFVAFTRAKTNLFLISNTDSEINTDILKREKFEIANIDEFDEFPITVDRVPNDNLPF